MAKKKVTEPQNVAICEGISLSHEFLEKKENRLLTLLLKGVVVYLLSMGSIGFYLSALNIEYNVALCHVVIFAMAIFCAMLYYRLFTENLGYFILLLGFGGLVVFLRTYINSGFYAIVNMTVDEAASYFNVEIQRLYNEQIGNRYLTVTIAALFIGVVLDILLNVYVSRRMQYVTVICIVMFFDVVPLYLVCEPDLFYAVMLLSGIALSYVYKSSRHYSPQISIKRTSSIFEEKRTSLSKKKEKELFYVYDVKALGQAGVVTLILVFLIMTVASAFKPKESFNVGYQVNKYKELSMVGASTLMTEGIMGFFRRTEDVGGMNTGRLGDVSSIHLDYETDLLVQITPYTFNRIYLKSFTGGYYNPYENCWTDIRETKNVNENATPEAEALRDAYENGEEYSAKATMRIRNIGADPRRYYLPYYSLNFEEGTMGYTDIEYYPRLENNKTYVSNEYYDDSKHYYDTDLEIPDANWETIQNTVLKIGLHGTEEEMIEQVIDYFQENIPYTIKPGKTPKKKDFINYFLDENEKGYCAHFASSATLIFRYVGIPARYVEGYAIDYNQFFNSEIVPRTNYEDYYDGYSELGETALVSVPVTDADAHAWVEVYLKGKGWVPVEVTPTGTIEEDNEDFWTMFGKVFGDSNEDAGAEVTGGNGGIHVSDKVVRSSALIALFVIVLLVLIWLMICLVKVLIYEIHYKKSTTSDRLIMDYQKLKRKKEKRDPKLKECLNYKQCVEYIVSYEQATLDEQKQDSARHVVTILEKAGFSKEILTEEEYGIAYDWLKTHL